MSEPIVVPFRHGPFWNFSYLVACPETREAAVIDPAWDAPAILMAAAARGFRITTTLATHSHSDHVNAIREVVDATSSTVLAHATEEAGLRAHFAGALEKVTGNFHFDIGAVRFTVLATPGHSPGSVTYVAGGYVFTGDALNLAGPGTPGPEPGSVEQLWESTRRIGSLPPETRIHPGHDSGPLAHSLIGEERLTNPAFLADSFEVFLAAVERATGRRHRD